tara:strand:- start:92 stop:247 length:156 start_codon:yes stop_codon:yes gene_type:complete
MFNACCCAQQSAECLRIGKIAESIADFLIYFSSILYNQNPEIEFLYSKIAI